MNGYFNFTSLICCPSLNLKHQSVENFYTVNMKFNQLIFDQFIQLITCTLPDYGLFFQGDTNVLTLITQDEDVSLQLMSKEDAANIILDKILSIMKERKQ